MFSANRIDCICVRAIKLLTGFIGSEMRADVLEMDG